jgi:hypothetical protein
MHLTHWLEMKFQLAGKGEESCGQRRNVFIFLWGTRLGIGEIVRCAALEFAIEITGDELEVGGATSTSVY